jgi:hypothetical protein
VLAKLLQHVGPNMPTIIIIVVVDVLPSSSVLTQLTLPALLSAHVDPAGILDIIKEFMVEQGWPLYSAALLKLDVAVHMLRPS